MVAMFRALRYGGHRVLRAVREETGQSIVELALAAPLILFFILASVTLLDVVQKRALVARLASEGARLAVYQDVGSIEGELRDSLKRSEPSSDVGRLRVRAVEPFAGEIGGSSLIGVPTKIVVSYDVPIPVMGIRPGGSTIPVSADVVVEKWPNAIWFDVE